MGYMGLGMQNWIYTMRPRKPFSIQRKPSFTKVPLYKRSFKLKLNASSNNITISICVLLIFTTLTITASSRWLKYERNHHIMQKEHMLRGNNFAFNFLINSGKNRLRTQNYTGAYSEFKLAKAIYPNNIEVNLLFKETVTLLCFEKGLYCNTLD